MVVNNPIKICSYSKSIPICIASDGRSYPQVHLDGKISSNGNAVFGIGSYENPHDDSIWILNEVRGETNDDIFVTIYHPKTDSYLLTHDVASPLTINNMEVTTTKDKQNPLCVWKLLKVSPTSAPSSSKSFIFKLVNNATGTALLDFERNLPEWGAYQREVSCSAKISLSSHSLDKSCWSIYPATYHQQRENSKSMSFLDKFIEHQILFYKFNLFLDGQHPATSNPLSWPLQPGINKGVSFWDDFYLNKHIYLIGNPIAWLLCFLALLASLFLFALSLSRGIAHMFLLPFEAWAFHYLPYFFCRTNLLYLHYYLPSFSFSALAVGCMLQHFSNSRKLGMFGIAFLGLCIALIYYGYLKISLLSNGMDSLSNETLDLLTDSTTHPLFILTQLK